MNNADPNAPFAPPPSAPPALTVEVAGDATKPRDHDQLHDELIAAGARPRSFEIHPGGRLLLHFATQEELERARPVIASAVAAHAPRPRPVRKTKAELRLALQGATTVAALRAVVADLIDL